MKGGSIASIGVLEAMNCDSFKTLEDSIGLQGWPARGGKRLMPKCERRVLIKRHQGGAGACDVPQQTDILKSYTYMDPMQVPLRTPISSVGAMASDVPNQTANILGQPLYGFPRMEAGVVFPTHLQNATTI